MIDRSYSGVEDPRVTRYRKYGGPLLSRCKVLVSTGVDRDNWVVGWSVILLTLLIGRGLTE